MATIQSLSDELKLRIISCLDNPAPSTSSLRRLSVVGITKSDDTWLKSLSQVSHSWRSLVFPILFQYVRVSLKYTAFTSAASLITNAQLFLDFVQQKCLSSVIESFVLVVRGKKKFNHGSACDIYESTDCGQFWSAMLHTLDPRTVTIVAPPPILGALTGCSTYTGDVQSFHMPYHILSLGYEAVPGTERMDTSDDARSSACFLLHARPWSTVLINEGSFSRAYLSSASKLRPPSILENTELQQHNMATVRNLSYIAIYPLYHHFEKVLNCFQDLERLYVQLTLNGQDDIIPHRCECCNRPKFLDDGQSAVELLIIYAALLNDVVQFTDNATAKNLRSLREFQVVDEDLSLVWGNVVAKFKFFVTEMDCDCGCIPPEERMNLPFGDWKEMGDGILVRDTEGPTKCFNPQFYGMAGL